MPSVHTDPLGHLLALSGDIKLARVGREVGSGLKTWRLDLLICPHHGHLWRPKSWVSCKGKQAVVSRGEDPSSQVCQAQPHSSSTPLTTVSVRSRFQAGGCRATEPTKWRAETWATLCSSSVSHASGTSSPAEEAMGPWQHPKTPSIVLSVS